MNKEFSKLCTPAKIYFALAVLGCILALFSGVKIVAVFVKLVFALIWTYILGWLCNKGFKTLSWFLVLLPYIIIALAIFGIYNMTHGQKQMMRSIQLQGAYGQEAFSEGIYMPGAKAARHQSAIVNRPTSGGPNPNTADMGY
jgi:hypothetical protein